MRTAGILLVVCMNHVNQLEVLQQGVRRRRQPDSSQQQRHDFVEALHY